MTNFDPQIRAAQLRKTADWIQANQPLFNWGSPLSCTCGVFVQVNSDLTRETINLEISGSYTRELGFLPKRCETSGLDLNEVRQWLIDQGFDLESTARLEFGSYENYEVFRDDFNAPDDPSYTDPDQVIARLLAWAAELDSVQVEVKA